MASLRVPERLEWGGAARHELSRPGGVLHLIYETPGGGHAAAVADTVTAALAPHDLAASVTTAGVPSLICITANLEGDS